MEHILFLALLAVVGLIRWLSQVAEERKNKEAAKRADGPAPNAPIPRAQPDSEEERIRKFMEALGVPTTTAPPPPPPPPPQQPTPPPPRKPKVMPVDPFPVPRPFRTGTPPPVPTAAPPAPPPMPPPPRAVPTVTSAPPPLPSPLHQRVAEVDPYDVDRQIGDEDETLVRAGHLAKNPAGAARGLATRLATSQGLRDAIVLREIFGPPRSMQPLDLTRPN